MIFNILGPQWWPIVGNTPQLRREARALGGQHLVFENWMKKYKSPVIGLRLGRENVIVALTYPIVHEVHTNEAFDGRPDNFFMRLRTMGSRFVYENFIEINFFSRNVEIVMKTICKLGITCTDGKFWAEQRNFLTKHLRRAGYGREPMEVQIQNELNELLEMITEFKGQAV